MIASLWLMTPVLSTVTLVRSEADWKKAHERKSRLLLILMVAAVWFVSRRKKKKKNWQERKEQKGMQCCFEV